jgi:hypothetical protein
MAVCDKPHAPNDLPMKKATQNTLSVRSWVGPTHVWVAWIKDKRLPLLGNETALSSRTTRNLNNTCVTGFHKCNEGILLAFHLADFIIAIISPLLSLSASLQS